jgi:aspartyl-tRNA(Asn)/glutamyl-tRNA(Gln) amidotransferase subunit C
MQVDDTLITKLETLSRLKLDKSQRSQIKDDIGNMIAMFSKIEEVNTDGVLPLTHMTQSTNPFREDIAVKHGNTEALLAQSPSTKDHFITVPKVIE